MKRANKIWKPVKNWRGEYSNSCSAYLCCSLRETDYKIINAYLFAHLLVVVMGLLLWYVKDKYNSIAICSAFLHVMWVIMALSSNLTTSKAMTCREITQLILAYLLMYASGFFYLYYGFKDLKKFNFMGENKSKQQQMAAEVLVFYVVFVPFSTSAVTSGMKYKDDNLNFEKLSGMFWFLSSISGVHAIALSYLLFSFIGQAEGTTILSIALFTTYSLFQYRIYKAHEYSMPVFWQRVDFAIFLVVFLSVMGGSIYSKEFSSYNAMSITILVGVLIIFLVSIILFIRDESQHLNKPVFYSPWVYPIYKYRPAKNDIVRHFTPSTMLITCCLVVGVWGVLTSVFIRPAWVGAVITCGAEVALI